MDHVWIRIDEELAGRRRNWQWLADEMGWSIQRLQNWKTRGVPAKVYPAIAVVFGKSIDWVAGVPEQRGTRSEKPLAVDDSRWPFTRVSLKQVMDLPPADFERVQGYIEATVTGWESSRPERKSRRG